MISYFIKENTYKYNFWVSAQVYIEKSPCIGHSHEEKSQENTGGC